MALLSGSGVKCKFNAISHSDFYLDDFNPKLNFSPTKSHRFKAKNHNVSSIVCQSRQPLIIVMSWNEGPLSQVPLKLQGRNMKLRDDVKAYVEGKLVKAVEKQHYLVRDVDVRLSVRGGEISKGPRMTKCEVTIYTKKHGVVRAEEESETTYGSIDAVCDIIRRKLRKMKEKDLQMVKRQPKLTDILDDGPLVSDEEDDIEDVNADNNTYNNGTEKVVKEKEFDMLPISTTEAAEHLVNLGHDFYVFRNLENGEVNVMYKRKRGGYGLIAPKKPNSGKK